MQSSGPSGLQKFIKELEFIDGTEIVNIDFSDEKQWIYNKDGECIGFNSKTPPQRHEAPPTTETDAPLPSGTGAPLHTQLGLPFLPEMQYVDLSIYADNKGFIDRADLEDAPAAAVFGEEPTEHTLGHATDWYDFEREG